MKPSISLVSSLTFCLVGNALRYLPASAQVTTDGTTNTTVNVDGNNFTIDQGDRVGDNLFQVSMNFPSLLWVRLHLIMSWILPISSVG